MDSVAFGATKVPTRTGTQVESTEVDGTGPKKRTSSRVQLAIRAQSVRRFALLQASPTINLGVKASD